MKRMQRIIILLFCMIPLLGDVFIPTVFANNGTIFRSYGLAYIPDQFPHYESTRYWHTGETLRCNYKLDIKDGNYYTFEIISSLKIAHTLDEGRVYSAEDTRLSFKIDLLELPEKQIIDFDTEPKVVEYETEDGLYTTYTWPECDYIDIRAHTYGSEGTYSRGRCIYILNCQYGIFLCENNSESMCKSIARWKFFFRENVWFLGIQLGLPFVCVISIGIWMRKKDKKRRAVAMRGPEHRRSCQEHKAPFYYHNPLVELNEHTALITGPLFCNAENYFL